MINPSKKGQGLLTLLRDKINLGKNVKAKVIICKFIIYNIIISINLLLCNLQ